MLTGWRAAPWPAVDDRHLLHMATQILNRRLYRELREKRGLTYNSDCSFNPSRAYPQASLLAVAFYVPPERTGEAAALTRELVQGLAAEGPTEAEMETARKQRGWIAPGRKARRRFQVAGAQRLGRLPISGQERVELRPEIVPRRSSGPC